jgi:hypothetical protein
MDDFKTKWLLKGKLVRDFKGFPLGHVRKVWLEDETGPLVVVEKPQETGKASSWEAIPIQEIESVSDCIRLKPPVFAE